MRWNDLELFGFKEQDDLNKILILGNGYYFELEQQIQDDNFIEMKVGKFLASGRKRLLWSYEFYTLADCLTYINYIKDEDKFYEVFGNLEGTIIGNVGEFNYLLEKVVHEE